mmetsp:Transcript_1589/g.1400  ORF Transcript_1589/g.1400 Transcript_1589/m.1400 type:complete len:347 (+) Transcript_1589:308-1348(+)
MISTEMKEIIKKSAESQSQMGKWGDALKEDLRKILTDDEIFLLDSNIEALNNKISLFKKKVNAKIENLKIKIVVPSFKNYNKEALLKSVINELRSILDKYSLRSFEFSSSTKSISLEKFSDKLEDVIDDPNEHIKTEKHIPKSDEVRCDIYEDTIKVKHCKIYGSSREANALFRLIFAYNRSFYQRREKAIEKNFESSILTKSIISIDEAKDYCKNVHSSSEDKSVKSIIKNRKNNNTEITKTVISESKKKLISKRLKEKNLPGSSVIEEKKDAKLRNSMMVKDNIKLVDRKVEKEAAADDSSLDSNEGIKSKKSVKNSERNIIDSSKTSSGIEGYDSDSDSNSNY